jgi:hypothetical protein
VATLILAAILRWRLPGSVLTANFLDSQDKLWLMQQLQPSAAAADPVDVVVPDSKAKSASQLAGGQLEQSKQLREHAGGSSSAGDLQHQQHHDHHNHQQQQEGGDADGQEGVQTAPMLLPPSMQQQQQQQVKLVKKQLSAGQQLLLTIGNRTIWYLMLLKALKVGLGGSHSRSQSGAVSHGTHVACVALTPLLLRHT